MGDRLGTQGAVGILPSFFDINRYMEGKYAYIHTFCDINRLWTWTWAFGLHFVISIVYGHGHGLLAFIL